jgi:hypothetical protein
VGAPGDRNSPPLGEEGGMVTFRLGKGTQPVGEGHRVFWVFPPENPGRDPRSTWGFLTRNRRRPAGAAGRAFIPEFSRRGERVRVARPARDHFGRAGQPGRRTTNAGGPSVSTCAGDLYRPRSRLRGVSCDAAFCRDLQRHPRHLCRFSAPSKIPDIDSARGARWNAYARALQCTRSLDRGETR